MAVRLHTDLNLPSISIASLMANHFVEKTPLGNEAIAYLNRGEEIPPSLTLSVIRHRLQQSDCEHGVLLEEIPQDVDQAQRLNKTLLCNYRVIVINLEASDDWIADRCFSRLYCPVCGKVYTNSPSSSDKKEYCDACGGSLQRRSDDSPEAVRSRLNAYRVQMQPLLNFYHTRNELISIPGDRPFEELYQDVLSTITKSITEQSQQEEAMATALRRTQ
jgi:adenylate kinase